MHTQTAFLKFIFWRIKKITRPHLVIPKKVGNILLNDKEIFNIVNFIGIYLLLLCLSAFILILCGYSLLHAFFQVASALGNVGLSTADSFGIIPKVVMIFDMWIGRLEIWSVLVLISILFSKKFTHN